MEYRFGFFRPNFVLCALVITCFVTACGSLPQLPQSNAPSETDAEKSVLQTFQPITDIPIPKGSRLDVDRSLVLGGGDYWTGRLVISISDSASDAFARYLQEMPRFGWKHITSVQTDISILAFARDHRIANIQIESRTLGGATVVKVMSPRANGSEQSNLNPQENIIRAQAIE